MARPYGGYGHCGILQATDSTQHDHDAMNIMSTDVHKIILCIKNMAGCKDRKLLKCGLVKLCAVPLCFTEEPGLGAVVGWHTTEGQLGTTETAEQRVQGRTYPAFPVQRASKALRRQRSEVSTEQPGETGLPAGAR